MGSRGKIKVPSKTPVIFCWNSPYTFVPIIYEENSKVAVAILNKKIKPCMEEVRVLC